MGAKRYIVRASKRWLYKRRVPTNLVPLVGRPTWTQSLGAVSEAKAEIAARALAVEHDRLIAGLERLSTDERAEVIAEGGWAAFKGLPERLHQGRVFVDKVAAYEDEPGADEPESAAVIIDARRTSKKMSAEAAQYRRTRGVVDSTAGDGVAVLIPIWQRISQPRSPKVAQKMGLYVRRFHDVVGLIEPKAVTRQHVLKFRDAMEAKHSRVTAIKHLEALHSLFNAAMKDGALNANPAHGVKVLSKPDIADEGKKPFQPAHVRSIFKAMKKESADFQMIVKIIAYHGMRSGEAAQLRPEDITTSMGIPVIRVHGAHGSIKNVASRREVPIHPAVRAELEAYARNAKGEWLFNSFPVWKAGRGAWFQRYASVWLRDVVGIKDDALTMHSFRHLFRTLAREIDMPEAVSRAIMGHTMGAGEHAKYGGVPSLAKRAEWIAKVDPLA